MAVSGVPSMESMDCDLPSSASNPDLQREMAQQQQHQQMSAQTAMLPPMAPPPLAEKPYCRLANFEIEKKIGRGQFSVVYRARCRTTGSVVALKKVQVC